MIEHNHKNTGFLHLCYFSCLSSCGIRGGAWALLNMPLGTSTLFPLPSHGAGEVTNTSSSHTVSHPRCASHRTPHRHLCNHSCFTKPVSPSLLTCSGTQHSPEFVPYPCCSIRKAPVLLLVIHDISFHWKKLSMSAS